MIPIRDSIPSRTTPVVNWALIAACAVVFLWQLGAPDRRLAAERFGMVPARVLGADRELVVESREPVRTARGIAYRVVRHRVPPAAVPDWLTLLTCIFLHGGWLHLIGNLWFLWIFGDNVEDRLGHLGFLVFYLACGIVASLVHLLTNAASALPTVGASGAIGGVMGAYFVLYPRAKVLTLVPIVFFVTMVVLPAPFFLGIWFLMQFVQGSAAIGGADGGVAWWAHVGGFAAGLATAVVLNATARLRPPVTVVRPGGERARIYRVHRRPRGDGWY